MTYYSLSRKRFQRNAAFENLPATKEYTYTRAIHARAENGRLKKESKLTWKLKNSFNDKKNYRNSKSEQINAQVWKYLSDQY